MPQQDLLFPWRTVKENLMLPMEIQGGISKVEMEQRADQALESDWIKRLGKEIPQRIIRWNATAGSICKNGADRIRSVASG